MSVAFMKKVLHESIKKKKLHLSTSKLPKIFLKTCDPNCKKYITVQTCTKKLRETHSTVGSTMIVAFWLFAFRPRNVSFMIFVCRAKNSLLQLIRTDQVDLHRWYQEPRGYSVIGYVCVVLSGALFKMRFDKRQRKGFQKCSPV